jgi:hypothetical protein
LRVMSLSAAPWETLQLLKAFSRAKCGGEIEVFFEKLAYTTGTWWFLPLRADAPECRRMVAAGKC